MVPASGNGVKSANTTDSFWLWLNSMRYDLISIAVLKLLETHMWSGRGEQEIV